MKHNLEIEKFTDSDGNQTCAIDFKKRNMCIFYMTHKFGCGETCFFADNNSSNMWAPLERRKGGEGSLIPHNECPIWKKENNG